MATSDKIDLYKLHKDEYATPKKPALVQTRPAQYLTVEGSGAPGTDLFQDRMGALYGAAYTIKMTRKFGGLEDYVVCKLEAQYWGADGGLELSGDAPGDLRWKFLIRTPDFVERVDLDEAVAQLLDKGKPETVKLVRLETLDEGACVQMLHVGPYDREQQTLDAMKAFMKEQGLAQSGPHHEVYLSDPRRVAPERLKTILRLPVSSS